MSETNPERSARSPLLDQFLNQLLPDIKLGLGALIDRENRRTMPERYAKRLPDTLLIVTLRPDLARAVASVAGEVERDFTDSCSRHGSLYDRRYRVELRQAEEEGGAAYRLSAHAGHPAHEDEAAPRPPAAELPVSDPDETRMEGVGGPGFEPGRFLIVVEDPDGTGREVFRITEPLTTIGRQSDDPGLHTTIELSGATHVSRRQLALVWDLRGGVPGFWLFNIGMNPVVVDEVEIPGERLGKGPLHLDRISDQATHWLGTKGAIRLGQEGPILHLERLEHDDMAPAADDPDATRAE